MTSINRLVNWLDVRIGIRQLTRRELTGYLLPRNINAWYSLGSVLLFIFTLQVVTGMLLLIYWPWRPCWSRRCFCTCCGKSMTSVG